MARRSCCLVVCVLLVACVQSTPSEGDATSSLQLPVSNDVDGKKELEFCRLCEQFVAGYYAWRFRMPLNTWATATSSLPSPADTARISQEEKHWPMSREVMCGDWGSESSNHLQLQALGLQNASAAQSRRQRCDEFYDSFIDPSDAIQVMDRMHTLVHGCVQDMGDQCPRKWLGTCPPRVACNCMSNNRCGSLLGHNSICISPCRNRACSNCEDMIDQSATAELSSNANSCPSGSFCDVGSSKLGVDVHPAF